MERLMFHAVFSFGNNQEITYGFVFSVWQQQHLVSHLLFWFVWWQSKKRKSSFYLFFSLFGRHFFQFGFLKMLSMFLHFKCFSRVAKRAPYLLISLAAGWSLLIFFHSLGSFLLLSNSIQQASIWRSYAIASAISCCSFRLRLFIANCSMLLE